MGSEAPLYCFPILCMVVQPSRVLLGRFKGDVSCAGPHGFHDERLCQPKVPSWNPNNLAHTSQMEILSSLWNRGTSFLHGFHKGSSAITLGSYSDEAALAGRSSRDTFYDTFQLPCHFYSLEHVSSVFGSVQRHHLPFLEDISPCAHGRRRHSLHR